MVTRFHYALGYPSFDSLIRKIEEWLSLKTPEVSNYSKSQVARRLAQRLVELGLTPYIHHYAKSYKRRNESNKGLIEFGGFEVNEVSGNVNLSSVLFARSVIEFHIHWVLVLYAIVSALVATKKNKGAAALLFGVGTESLFAEGSDKRFIDYCHRGPIDVLRNAKRLLVQINMRKESIDTAHIEYSRFPLFTLLYENAETQALLQLIKSHVKIFFVFWMSIAKLPLVSIIGRDLAYHALVANLNQRQLIEAIVITNSNYSAQPLWMSSLANRNFNTHMVWYAQNTVPIVYRDNPVPVNVANYRHISVDISWVWTKGYAGYLSSLGHQSEIRVVGPIVWHMPNSASSPSSTKDEVIISVFDVSPVNDAFADELGLYGNYYSPENMIQFIRSIVEVLNKIRKGTEKSIRIMLKHKREHHDRHSKEYINQISWLKESGEIEITPYDENIFSVIGSSALVIVVPYSSPAYVADSLRVPAVFFDPTGEVFPVYEQSENIHFASSKDQLQEIISNVLSNRKLLENEPR